jgi:hypothetical protein
MYRLTRWMGCLSVVVCWAAFANTAAAAEFPQCPAAGADTGCQYLITVGPLGASLATDPSQPSYANNTSATHEPGTPTDALVGIQNDTSTPLTSFNINGPITFEFDGDGICDNASGVVPKGCQTPSGSTACGPAAGPCSFPPPAGEPANYPDFEDYVPPQPIPAWPNGDVQNGYEGPTSWFSNVGPSPHNTGTVNFSPGIPPGGSTYFSLEAAPGQLPVTTWLTMTQAAGGLHGAVLYVLHGMRVQSTGDLTGGYGHVTGNVAFRLFKNNTCSGGSIAAGTSTVPSPTLVSNSIPMNSPGTYNWQAEYSGDTTNAPSETVCGTQTVVVPKGANVGLPSNRRCVSRLVARLRIGKVRARAVEVFANGKLVGHFAGKFNLRIRKHEQLAVIVSTAVSAFGRKLTAANLFRQQSRNYRACR